MWIPSVGDVVKSGDTVFVVAARFKVDENIQLDDGLSEESRVYALENCEPLHPAQKCDEPAKYWSVAGTKYPLERIYSDDGSMLVRASFMPSGQYIKVPSVETSFEATCEGFSTFFRGTFVDESVEMPILPQWEHLRESA